MALSNTKIKNWCTQQNKWLAVVLIAGFIGVLSFVILLYTPQNKWLAVLIAGFIGVLSFAIGMIMVKKGFNVRNTVATISASVSKVVKN